MRMASWWLCVWRLCVLVWDMGSDGSALIVEGLAGIWLVLLFGLMALATVLAPCKLTAQPLRLWPLTGMGYSNALAISSLGRALILMMGTMASGTLWAASGGLARELMRWPLPCVRAGARCVGLRLWGRRSFREL